MRHCRFPPQSTKVNPETLQQQIERKLSDLVKFCSHTADKYSKLLDRTLKLLEDVIPTLPLQPLPVITEKIDKLVPSQKVAH